MKLTPRLQVIAEKVDKGSIVADIGTDHGYVPIYLIENKISTKVIAADINRGPLDNARKQILMYNFQDEIETRLGNGLDVIKPGEVDTLIIAGMGGLLIRDILMDNLDTTKSIEKLILQPMVAQADLRKWLLSNGFKIIDEQLAKEGHKYYEILVVVKGKDTVKEDIYYEIGAKLIEKQDPLLEGYIIKQIGIQHSILKSLENQSSDNACQKSVECRDKIFKLEEVLKCL